MLTERKLRCFMAVADTLSFSNAAKLLYMSQQAVSKNIAGLEEDLGFPLFVRSRQIELTEPGRKCYELCSRMMKEYGSAISDIRKSYRDAISDTFTIGIQSYLDFGSAVTDAIGVVHEHHPDLTINVLRYDPNTLLERLLNKSLGMIIINQRYLRRVSGLREAKLSSDLLAIMVSETHPLITSDSTAADFVTLPFIVDILQNETKDEYDRRIDREIKVWGLKPESIVSTPDRDSAYTAAELGLGIIVGTETSRMAQGRRLKRYLIDRTEPVLAVWRAETPPPWIEPLVALLQRNLKKR
ncbi:MAG: LysR family transcriptional regulator [Oscillospiraceae bacterium]|nr:LysR family transcriptional regulator [Oscillospiraceae bacterium]